METKFRAFKTHHNTVYFTSCRTTNTEKSNINWSIIPHFYSSPTLHPICTNSVSPTTTAPHCTLYVPIQSVQPQQPHTAPYMYQFSQSNHSSPTLHPICTNSVSPTTTAQLSRVAALLRLFQLQCCGTCVTSINLLIIFANSNYKAPHYVIFSKLKTLHSVTSQFSPHHPVLQHPQCMPALQLIDRISRPNQIKHTQR